MGSVIVTLTWPEVCLAAHAATMRRVQNMKHGNAHKWNAPSDVAAWDNDVTGCICEMALAKHLDRFWSGAIGDYRAADVGKAYQVRGTRHGNGRLTLHPEDFDEMPYVLGRVSDNRVTLAGWLYGREGKLQEYWQAPPSRPNQPAFFVPNALLHDMATVAEIEAREKAA
jgi:hypothetical protein